MGFFSNTHVTQAGLQGSLGPSVSPWEMAQQSFYQQYNVDSQLALDQELASRWTQSLDALRETGQNFSPPTGSLMYRRFAESLQTGAPVQEDNFNPLYTRGGVPQPSREAEEMARANEAIRRLNNPNIRTFEQILQDVSSMQRDTEERTASMSERTGTLGTVAGMVGSIAGSFTLRDPVNLATAPIGFGRTIATRIATDMAIAGITTGVTELTDVNPNRALVGLPERNPYYDIAASALGAGLLRGALIEPLGHAFGRLRAAGEDINFDFRDEQLQQMFKEHEALPAARAASSILDDAIVFEHANPYGDGHIAGYRWEAELQATAHALNGEPAPHVDVPPLPAEYLDRELSFKSVKETAPELWNELETAGTRLITLDNNIAEATSKELTIPDAVRLVDPEAAGKLDQLSKVVNDMSLAEPIRAAADMEARGIVLRVGQDKIMKAVSTADTVVKHEVRNLRATRRAANKTYRAAYQKVEKEAERLQLAEAAKRTAYQTQSINMLGPSLTSEPLTGPLTRFDFVEAHGEKVDAAEKTIPQEADAVNDLQIDPETNTVDIGNKTPVSADFKVPLDEGELSVKEILDDLAEDQRLEEAMKGCAL